MCPKYLEKAVGTQEGIYERHVRKMKQRTLSCLIATHQRYYTEALYLRIRVLLLFLVVSELSFLLQMSNITSFFKRASIGGDEFASSLTSLQVGKKSHQQNFASETKS